jgi:hypothetical protein
MKKMYTYLLFFILISCKNKQGQPEKKEFVPQDKPTSYYKTISDIPPPAGFVRITTTVASFAEWLRRLPLKKEKQVYLFNGALKPN